MFKKLLVRGLLVALFAMIPLGFAMGVGSSVRVQKAAIYYNEKRPFSFYYPYSYKYYYPHPRLRQNSSNSCYWLYTNGTYVYYCS